jgi:hypothetical protein
LAAIAAGEEDPAKLASLGDERLKASEQELQRALRGRVHAAHRLILGLYLKQVELIDEQVAVLEREISAAMQPHEAAVERLADVPGLAYSGLSGRFSITRFATSSMVQAIQKRKRALLRQLRRLGYAVQITPIQDAARVEG